jgi:hypothetical protein
MKRYFNSILTVLLLVSAITGCKKDEKQVVFEGGTAPVLTGAYRGPVVLTIPDRAKTAFTLSWTNPNYMFNTGLSSQNVNYTMQFDTVGANFTNPAKQEVSVSNELTATFSVDDLNKIMTRMSLVADIPHNLEVRVISNINGAVPLTSNAIRFTGIVPFEDFAIPPPSTNELYITGSAVPSSWTNTPPMSQKLTRVSRGEYFIIMSFTPGGQYKFLSNQGQWQPQYGGSSATGGPIGFNLGSGSDPDAIPTPSEAGTYKVTLNFTTGRYTVVKQ